MAESIKARVHGLSDMSDAYELTFLLKAILADLTAIYTVGSAIFADITAIRTKLAASIVDVAAMRTPIAASVVDVAALNARLNTAMISPPGLAIGSVSKKVPKAVNAIQAVVGGTLVFAAAGTAMSVLAGTVAQNKFAIWAFYMDSVGTITTSTKTADANTAALAYAALPAIPANKVQVGFVIVTNSGAPGFVGGTDDLDLAGNTVIYVDSIGIQAPAITLTAATPAALTASTPAALTATAPSALTLTA